MAKRSGRFASFLWLMFVLLILGVTGWGIGHWLESLNSDLEKVIVGAGLTVFGSVISLTFAKAYEARVALQRELREKKAPVYEELVHRFFDIFFADKMGKPKPTDAQYQEFFFYAIEKLTAWGSDKTIRAFGDLRLGGGGDTTRFMFTLESFLKALREDLGHSSSDMPVGSILRLFINDLDEHMLQALATGAPVTEGPWAKQSTADQPPADQPPAEQSPPEHSPPDRSSTGG